MDQPSKLPGVRLLIFLTSFTLIFTTVWMVTWREREFLPHSSIHLLTPTTHAITHPHHNLTPNTTTLQEVMRERAENLHRQCRILGLSHGKMLPPLSKLPGLKMKGIFSLCMANKGGSTSWQILSGQLRPLRRRTTTTRLLGVVSVRHPLARLASAYRDKYVGGLPISHYNATFRRKTESTQSWDLRWRSYWLPALISTGRVSNTSFLASLHQENVQQDRDTRGYKVNVYGNANVRHRDMAGRMVRTYGNTNVRHTEVASHMVNVYDMANVEHKDMAGHMLSAYGDVDAELRRRFRDVSFTFAEFIWHVLWSHRVGLQDLHWMSTSSLCRPCRHHYDYVVHLETATEEVRYLLHLAHYPANITLPLRHRTKYQPTSDLLAFKQLPPYLLQKILELYSQDFTLFGYSPDTV